MVTKHNKASDRIAVGIGASYKLGLGNGSLRNINVSSEGIGLRTYVDVALKKQFYITGGYEQNYVSQFRAIINLPKTAL